MRHPLPGEVREGRYGNPVLRKLEPSGSLRDRLTGRTFPTEVGDRGAALYVEPSGAAPPPELEPMPATPEEGWWTHPYAGGPMVKVPGFPRALYPPDVPAPYVPSVKGPDVVAYKRTICRLGRWAPWDPAAWDEAFNNAFSHGRGTGLVGDTGVAGVQRQQNISPASGWIGKATFNTLRSARVPTGPHEGEMAMDSVAVNLIEEAWALFQAPPPVTVEDVETSMTDYLLRSIGAASRWHYSQARPISNFGIPPDQTQTADCSGQSTSVYYWARQDTGAPVPDPNRFCPGYGGYSGAGWTGSLIAAPRCSAPYRVGDLGLYGDSTGDTSHVVTCYAPGSASTAEWCSNGSEEAPYAVELHYRGDYLCTVRPGLGVT